MVYKTKISSRRHKKNMTGKEVIPNEDTGQRSFTFDIRKISVCSNFFIIFINYHHPGV